MTNPTRPKVLPTESSIQQPPSLGAEFAQTILMGRDLLTAWKHRYEASQRALAQAQEENRVKGECLGLAIEALGSYADTFTGAPGYALSILNRIETHLAQLEPEEETG